MNNNSIINSTKMINSFINNSFIDNNTLSIT